MITTERDTFNFARAVEVITSERRLWAVVTTSRGGAQAIRHSLAEASLEPGLILGVGVFFDDPQTHGALCRRSLMWALHHRGIPFRARIDERAVLVSNPMQLSREKLLEVEAIFVLTEEQHTKMLDQENLRAKMSVIQGGRHPLMQSRPSATLTLVS